MHVCMYVCVCVVVVVGGGGGGGDCGGGGVQPLSWPHPD